MTWPKDKLMFGVGAFGLLVAILNLYSFHSPHKTTFERYFGLVWFFFAAVFFYRGYRPGTGR